MKQKNVYMFSSMALLALLAAIVTLRSILGDYILNPMLTAGRAAWQMVSSVDQNIYWSALIITCLILTIRIIPKKKRDQTSSAYRYNYKPPTPYHHWLIAFKDSALGPNEQEYLRENLHELYKTFSASHSQADSSAQEPSLSPAAKQFLFSQNGDKKSISYLIPRWVRRLAGKYFYKDNASIDELLTWMETQLEIKNGD